MANATKDFADDCGAMPAHQVANESAGERVGAALAAAAAGEKLVEFIEIDGGTYDKLVQEFRLVLEPPTVLGGHRNAFVEPARDRVAGRRTIDEHMCNLVSQDVVECAVGICRRT